jgi:outer membrane protein assembly factor BamB
MNRRVPIIIALLVGLPLLAWGIVFWSDRHEGVGRTKPQVAGLGVSADDADTLGTDDEEEPPVPLPVAVTRQETQETPAEASALGNLNVLIADRGNNRLLEVSPDKKILWEYDFDLPKSGLGADDAFFTDGGAHIIAGLEEWQEIELIDVATHAVIWSYGVPGKGGSKAGELHTPDDPYMLPNGDVIVADIGSCRILEISPDQKIVRQYGLADQCGTDPGELNKPNGDTPLPDGHVLVSNIRGHDLIELDQDWKPVFSMVLPLAYPSDPQMTKAGNILVAGYTDPGKILEVAKDGTIVWQQAYPEGDLRLKRPSLAVELPNGNILANDDQDHRVIVIDKATHQIVWQYGVSGKPGRAPGQLNVPDGVSFISADIPVPPQAVQPDTYTVGAMSRHPTSFQNLVVKIKGYLLKKDAGSLIISDEPDGAIGRYDLPVVASGLDAVVAGKPFLFTGRIVEGGLEASNGNPFHFELIQPPQSP